MYVVTTVWSSVLEDSRRSVRHRLANRNAIRVDVLDDCWVEFGGPSKFSRFYYRISCRRREFGVSTHIAQRWVLKGVPQGIEELVCQGLPAGGVCW